MIEMSLLLWFSQVKVSMEYPLRPPLFFLTLCDDKIGYDPDESTPRPSTSGIYSGWFNELRALEAEVGQKSNLNLFLRP